MRKIYHITHVNNLAGIVRDGTLWSDAERLRRGVACDLVGMSEIKQRRLTELDVDCHPGTKVGEYVPFYFCPRSIMLFILYKRNHPSLTYRGGQTSMIHLEASLQATIDWADGAGVRWAFSDRNAGGRYAQFFNSTADLRNVNWAAIAATDFQDPVVKEGKQAEFLTHEQFSWHLVERIGVFDDSIRERAVEAIGEASHRPDVQVRTDWYY